MTEEIKRDRWQRPILPHPMTGIEEAYTRASTLSNAIDDDFNLAAWKQRQILLGISQRPDLVAKIQSAHGDKKLLNEIVQTVMEVAGSSAAANVGTAIHSFCETMDKGEKPPLGFDKIDPRIRASLKAYWETMKPYKMIAIEQFVATRAVMSAGTFDRIVEKDGKLYIADIKTGYNAPDYAHSAAVQMAVYSRGQEYDVKDGWGLKMPEDVGVQQDVGILIHLPAVGEPVCRLYEIDLDTGWKMARLAYRTRQWWKEKPTELIS